MRIGLISDTHNYFSAKLNSVFEKVDVILHAGDIIDIEIIHQLRKIAPVEAVYGNCDMHSTARLLPSRLHLKYEKIHFYMTHNIGGIQQFLWKIKRKQLKPLPQIVIHGHTHVPSNDNRNGVMFINPGSASTGRMGHPPTVKILEVKKGELLTEELIKLI